jgi:enoyl-CoA hydratase/carnithine racemase
MQTVLSKTPRVIAERDGAIGWITFNNPERHNAMSLDMWEALPEILDAYGKDPAIRVVVMKGAGQKAFVSGADISEFETARGTPEKVKKYEEITDRATDHAVHLGKPTIAMIRGYCIGGGLGIALSCDIRIATEASRFGIPAAKLGLGYRHEGVKKLVDVVGPSYAKEIFFTARQFSAAEALQMRLINWAVPDAELEKTVRATCDLIIQNAPLTIEAAKGVIGELTKVGSDLDADHCESLINACFDSADYQEGRKAFMEKRKPVFTGR